MDSTSPLRQSASVSSRLSAIDVSQLDKINAIPNKTKNNVLTDGLCHEDKLYLEALMDEESLDSDEEATLNLTDHGGSPWSPPMAGRPMMNNKRIKRMKRSSYTITMSLEDISYIRPSWGMSKGMKRLELVKDKRKRKKPVNNSKLDKNSSTKTGQSSTQRRGSASSSPDGKTANQREVDDDDEVNQKAIILSAYHILLGALVLLLISLMLLSYLVEARRRQEKVLRSRLELSPSERSFKIMKLEEGNLVRVGAFQVNYGRGIPRNLRHDECNCETFEAETRRQQMQAIDQTNGDAATNQNETPPTIGDDCFACFDWSHRANMQVFINKSRSLTGLRVNDWLTSQRRRPQQLISSYEDQSITCYDVKWQSYDSLRTPIVDCFYINDNDQWLGLGDIQSPAGFLNKIDQSVPSAIATNLTSEFNLRQLPATSNKTINEQANESSQSSSKYVRELTFGSHVDLQLLTSSGFFVGNVRTDFKRAIRISAEQREICLVVYCTERCHRVWSKSEDVTRFRFQNNLLEYSICSAMNLKVLVAQLVGERSRLFAQSPIAGTVRSARLSSSESLSTSHTVLEQQQQQLEVQAHSTPALNSGLQEQRPAGILTPEVAAPNLIGQTSPITPSTTTTKRQLDGLGLLEGTIFITDSAFIETLDGKTLRQHADKIVKLDLKTKPILVLDSRWQLYLGSYQINSVHFPKAKFLFEILHNKGFKMVLTVKPYVDATIGVASLTQLLDSGRIVSAKYQQQGSTTNPDELAYDGGGSSNNSANRISVSSQIDSKKRFIFRRKSFFHYTNETIYLLDENRNSSDKLDGVNLRTPYLFECKESHAGQCALIDLAHNRNRQWLIELIKRSNFLVQEADGILFAGAHPNPTEWDETYRDATSQLIDQLTYKENLFVIPQWTCNFNYVQLAPRERNWNGLQSTLSSVLTLSALGLALVHPGSVWGDLRGRETGGGGGMSMPADEEDRNRAEEELIVRWLQLAVFLPILQFNDLEPVDKFNLQEQMQQLLKLRKLYVVPELKRNLPTNPFTSAGSGEAGGEFTRQQPALRQIVWSSTSMNVGMQPNSGNSSGSSSGGGGSFQTQPNHQQASQQAAEALSQQFMIGPDLLVAPVLDAGQRQKDIYLPTGYWHDELRQTNVRGGKWLRNYPVELNEIAWFMRARR